MQLFFTPDINSELYTLPEEESKHAIRVLRMKTGDVMNLIDGKGNLYTAEIISDNPKRCEVKITDTKKEFEKRNHYLHIAIAPTKNIERFEWFLEKATEIGIDEITPIESKNSERAVVKNERLNKVIVSAIKQSIKAYLPKLNEIKPFEKFLKEFSADGKYIAHCREGVKQNLKTIYSKNKSAIILIGPEGDFTKDEIELAKQNGFKEITLGNSRLRTETAGVVACTIINNLNEG